MGLKVVDFKCSQCGVKERLVEFSVTKIKCCGGMAHALISAPRVVGADSFNAHFDITQGRYFESPEQKAAWLRSKDKVQVEGDLSPRCSRGGRIICTKEQARKLVGKNARNVRQSDIPGLTRNRRTSLSMAPSGA